MESSGLVGGKIGGQVVEEIEGWRGENKKRTDRDIIIFMFFYTTLL